MNWLLNWLRRRRLERRARYLVAEAFHSREPLHGTSLKPRHASRWVLLDFEVDGDCPTRIWFGVLRHPRPYPFSRQSHKVIERYCYDVQAGAVAVERGHNITRERGSDAD